MSISKRESFTLFEVLISLVILGVMLVSLTQVFIRDDSLSIYYKLQELENTYIESGVIKNDVDIKLNHNQ